MSTIPDRDQDLIQFAVDHAEPWVQNAAQIGIPPAAAAQFGTLMNEAQNAFNAARAAREASKAATVTQDTALKNLRNAAGDLVKLIRAFAPTTSDPAKVYATALIPPPADPQRNQPPTAATNLKASLDATTGEIKVTWKAVQTEPGVSYIVKRRTPSTSGGSFVFLGVATGRKSFVDTTIPAGVTQLEYVVQPQRARLTGPESAILTVRFGPGGAGSANVAFSTETNDNASNTANNNNKLVSSTTTTSTRRLVA